jgi:hypothetical protein
MRETLDTITIVEQDIVDEKRYGLLNRIFESALKKQRYTENRVYVNCTRIDKDKIGFDVIETDEEFAVFSGLQLGVKCFNHQKLKDCNNKLFGIKSILQIGEDGGKFECINVNKDVATFREMNGASEPISFNPPSALDIQHTQSYLSNSAWHVIFIFET